jgi:chaperonin GroES
MTGLTSEDRVRPLSDRVLVRRLEPEKVTKGGLVLPYVAQVHQKEGTVLAVGPGKMLEDGVVVPMTVQEGDRVLFPTFAGTQIGDDVDLVVMREEEILAVVGA